MHWDLTIRMAELLVVVGVAWKALRVLDRFQLTLENFPLHRH